MTSNSLGNLNTLEVARHRLGGIGVSTLYNWISAGRIRALKIGGRTFVADAEIDRVIQEANTQATAKAAARRDRRAA